MSANLEILFSSAARVQMLQLFLLNPDRQFYQREMEREIGQPIRAVQREVERLEGIGLLRRSQEGNRVFYRLDPGFPLLKQLTALFQTVASAEGMGSAAQAGRQLPPEPSMIRQPFPWMETLHVSPLPSSLRDLQIKGEWDRAY